MSTRPAFLSREHVTQKVKINGQRTFYVAHNGDVLAEIFLRIKGTCSLEPIVLYDFAGAILNDTDLQLGRLPPTLHESTDLMNQDL